MKKRTLILSALLLLALTATAVALAANRPKPFDSSKLEEGAVCPKCHDGIICMTEGPEDKDFELCPVSGSRYRHVIDVRTWDWACTGCGMHLARAASVPVDIFCANEETCEKAQEWRGTIRSFNRK